MANSVAAGRFKDRCLQLLDEVAKTKTPVIVTKDERVRRYDHVRTVW
jgi:hypothetical protein